MKIAAIPLKSYRKKPIVIQAVQWTGDNPEQIQAFCSDARFGGPCVFIKTLEGLMTGDQGDWIIKGMQGEYYPCKPSIFAATYEEVP